MKTRILAIAPYQGMKEVLVSLQESWPDIELTVQIGNLQNGLQILQNCDLDDYDIVLSRGGTARLIASHIQIPVVAVEISVYDVLHAIKLAENYTSSFAIVGYPAITDCARILCNLLQYNIKIITLGEGIDPYEVVKSLKKDGCEMILCDMIGTSVANDLGMNFILITSGRESIETALEQCVSIARLFSLQRQQALVLKTAVVQSRESLFVYTKDGSLFFSSLERSQATEPFFTYVETHLNEFLNDPRLRLEDRVGSLLFSLYSRHININGTPYVYIYLLLQDAPVSIDELGISLYDSREQKKNSSFYYGSANLVGNNARLMEQYAKTLYPVLITGETGTGKDKAAQFIYEHSEYRKSPFVTIDCTQANPKKWTYLMESVNSPLNDLHTTIYIKNIQQLDEALANSFISYLIQGDIHRRNRLIFSCTIGESVTEESVCCRTLMNALSCLVLRLKPLRERTEDIPGIATLYISQINNELGKQIVGFEPEAMALMKQYSWRENLSQFKRIIRELVLQTESYYIPTHLVQHLLNQEQPAHPHSGSGGLETLNLNQTLDLINYDIVRIVLEQENGNRSRAASRLGISRSTLWRLLRQ